MARVRLLALTLSTLPALGGCATQATSDDVEASTEAVALASGGLFGDLCQEPTPTSDGSVMLAPCPSELGPGSVQRFDVATKTATVVGLYGPSEYISNMGRDGDKTWFVKLRRPAPHAFDRGFEMTVRADDGSTYTMNVPSAPPPYVTGFVKAPIQPVIMGSKVVVRADQYLYVGDLQTGGEPKRFFLEREPDGYKFTRANGKLLITAYEKAAVLDVTSPEATLTWLTLPSGQPIEEVASDTFDGQTLIVLHRKPLLDASPYRAYELARLNIVTGAFNVLTKTPFFDNTILGSPFVGVRHGELFFTGLDENGRFVARLPLTSDTPININVVPVDPLPGEEMLDFTLKVSEDGKLIVWRAHVYPSSSIVRGQRTDSSLPPFRLLDDPHRFYEVSSMAANRVLFDLMTDGTLMVGSDGQVTHLDEPHGFAALNSDATAVFAPVTCPGPGQQRYNISRVDGVPKVVVPCRLRSIRDQGEWFQTIPQSKAVLYTIKGPRYIDLEKPTHYSTVLVEP